jgi:hypothetical protein
MLGYPESLEIVAVGGLRERKGIAECLPWRVAFDDRRQVQD